MTPVIPRPARTALAALALALAPLTGAPAPEVTAIDALPFVIERPGRYALARDLAAPPGVDALRVRASDVRIDLGGFELLGQAGTLAGIVADEGLERVEVHGGRVMRFGLDGVDLSGVRGARLVALELFDNGGHGASLGEDAEVRDVRAEINHGGAGVWAGARAELRDVHALRNTYGGVRAGPESTLVGCRGERSEYGPGVRAGSGSLLRGCSAEANLDGGVEADPGSTLIRCVAARNLAFGLRAGERSLLIECEARDTVDGPGIELGPGASADGCVTARNRHAGIEAETGSVVRGCRSSANDGPGIDARGALLVAGCVCADSVGSDGLLVTGIGTTVRENRALRNAGADLRVLGRGHVVVGNRARRGRFEVAEGSLVGPLVEAPTQDPFANVLEGE